MTIKTKYLFVKRWLTINTFARGSLLLLLLVISACETSDFNSNTIDRDTGSITAKNHWLTESDAELLKSGDVFEVRKAIYNISMYKTDDSTGFLIGLWDGNNRLGTEFNIEVINNPIVRLKIAQSLIQKNIENPAYFSYIKQHINSDNLAVRTVSAEALRDVYKPEAQDLMRVLAESDDEAIADIALSGLKHQTIFGGNRDNARELWAELKKLNIVHKGLIGKYDRMYDEYLHTRENLKKEAINK